MGKLTFKTNGVPDEKYFTFNGRIYFNCLDCGKTMSRDFSEDHIEYINDYIGKDIEIVLYCGGCNKQHSIPIKIKEVSYHVKIEFDQKDLKKDN